MKAEPNRKADIYAMAAPKLAQAADRWPDSQLAMDGLFMAGESDFANEYPAANLYYEKLVKSFPNNRYLDQVDKRRLAIARYWLDSNRESPEPFYYVNWTNKERPWRDRRGHGLRVMTKFASTIPPASWPTTPRSPLATSISRTASFIRPTIITPTCGRPIRPASINSCALFGNEGEAEQLHGEAYGGTALDETEKLIKQTRRQFPMEAEREREFLDKAAAEARFRKAEQLMLLAEFYDRRAEYRAADHYYARIAREFHDTPLAAKANERIPQIAGLPPTPPQYLPWLVAMFPESDKVKPLLQASQKAQEEENSPRRAASHTPEVQQATYGQQP